MSPTESDGGNLSSMAYFAAARENQPAAPPESPPGDATRLDAAVVTEPILSLAADYERQGLPVTHPEIGPKMLLIAAQLRALAVALPGLIESDRTNVTLDALGQRYIRENDELRAELTRLRARMEAENEHWLAIANENYRDMKKQRDEARSCCPLPRLPRNHD